MAAIVKSKSYSFMSRIVDTYFRPSVSNALIKQSAILAALATFNAGLAVLMSWYAVFRIGVGAETDAFFASTALPQFLFNLLTATLLPVLVPLFATRDDTQFRRGTSLSRVLQIPRGSRHRDSASGNARRCARGARAVPLEERKDL